MKSKVAIITYANKPLIKHSYSIINHVHQAISFITQGRIGFDKLLNEDENDIHVDKRSIENQCPKFVGEKNMN